MFNELFAICLLVDDFDKSLNFYSKVLGLKIRNNNSKFADFDLNGTSLAIFEKSEAIAMFPNKYMKSGGGAVIAFQVKDIQKACANLESKGVEILEGPKTTEWGQKVAYFVDPDGNVLEVSER